MIMCFIVLVLIFGVFLYVLIGIRPWSFSEQEESETPDIPITDDLIGHTVSYRDVRTAAVEIKEWEKGQFTARIKESNQFSSGDETVVVLEDACRIETKDGFGYVFYTEEEKITEDGTEEETEDLLKTDSVLDIMKETVFIESEHEAVYDFGIPEGTIVEIQYHSYEYGSDEAKAKKIYADMVIEK